MERVLVKLQRTDDVHRHPIPGNNIDSEDVVAHDEFWRESRLVARS